MLIGRELTGKLLNRNGNNIKLNYLLTLINMKTFRVSFVDDISAKTEEGAYIILLNYLRDCAEYGDATAFQFEEVEHKEYQTH